VSWGAVIAGAFVAAALSLALLALGTGVGLSAASPWANAGASSSAIGWTAIIWMVVMQFIASSIGGYLAGRLRTKWVNVHTHEVYFRDTHGFLVWAVGLVITAAFLTAAAASMIGGVAPHAQQAADTARKSVAHSMY
jgi:MFS family permease